MFSLTPTPPHGNITNILCDRIPVKTENEQLLRGDFVYSSKNIYAEMLELLPILRKTINMNVVIIIKQKFDD